MSQNLYDEKIDLYLYGRMSAVEVKAFEEELAQNPTLNAALRSRKFERDAMGMLIKDEYKQKVKEWMPSLTEIFNKNELKGEQENTEAQHSTQAKSELIQKPRQRMLVYSLAAAIALLLLIGVIANEWLSSSYSNEGLIASYYQEPQNDILEQNLRGESKETNNLYEKGKHAYSNQEYQDAIIIFRSLPETNEQGLYALAHSQYKIGNFSQALSTFQKVGVLNGRFQEKANYYQLFCYLNTNQPKDDFNHLLDSMASNKYHSFQKEAEEIQKKLNSYWRRFAE